MYLVQYQWNKGISPAPTGQGRVAWYLPVQPLPSSHSQYTLPLRYQLFDDQTMIQMAKLLNSYIFGWYNGRFNWIENYFWIWKSRVMLYISYWMLTLLTVHRGLRYPLTSESTLAWDFLYKSKINAIHWHKILLINKNFKKCTLIQSEFTVS